MLYFIRQVKLRLHYDLKEFEEDLETLREAERHSPLFNVIL